MAKLRSEQLGSTHPGLAYAFVEICKLPDYIFFYKKEEKNMM